MRITPKRINASQGRLTVKALQGAGSKQRLKSVLWFWGDKNGDTRKVERFDMDKNLSKAHDQLMLAGKGQKNFPRRSRPYSHDVQRWKDGAPAEPFLRAHGPASGQRRLTAKQARTLLDKKPKP